MAEIIPGTVSTGEFKQFEGGLLMPAYLYPDNIGTRWSAGIPAGGLAGNILPSIYLGNGIVIAGGAADGMVYRSTDYGLTWDAGTLNTTYTNADLTRTLEVAATVRCAITVAGGNAYAQGFSDAATPPVTVASGIVGIQAGLLNEDNSFQLVFKVYPGRRYRINSSVANGTVTLGNWFETYL